ncbi:MAG: sulfatase-like hydrolase/transferase [Planctomycetaceae bacterium]|jgi:arylsulfatase|nr:sulfatase-like hydrolase/transferase [Planctomycetaceae bacterium]
MKTKIILFMFSLLICVVVSAATATLSKAAERPNIILILSDDMGFSDLGCYGGEISTPQLDRLASGGVRFTQFYNTARCCPTRASLLTGLHPHQAGMGHMTGAKHREPGYRGDLLPSAVTIAEVLKTANYRTYCIGKWHVTDQTNPNGSKHNWPLQRGFDRYYGIVTGMANYFDPHRLVRDNATVSPFADADYKPEGEYYLTNALSDNAVKFIKDHKTKTPEQPFFMYVAYTAAHWPMHAPENAIAKYKGKYDAGYKPARETRYEKLQQLGAISKQWELSPQANDWENVHNKKWETRCMEVYAAMISEMDKGIGQITNSLKETGLYDNTVILFLQDNGACAETIGRTETPDQIDRPDKPPFEPIARDVIDPPLNNRTRDGYPVRRGKNVLPGAGDTFIAYGRGWANVSNTPFREYKHWVHEGGISTPLIIHAPALINDSVKGKFYHEYGQLVDVMATCVDLAGAEYPKQRKNVAVTPLEGISLKPALDGKSLQRTKPLFWEHEGNRAIRDGKWKLVAKGPQGDWELYDIESDRSEMHNLATQNPQLVEKLSKQWNEWAVRANVLPWPWTKKNNDVVPDKTRGVKLKFDFTKDEKKIADISGKENKISVYGNIKFTSKDDFSARYFDGESYIEVDKSAALYCAETAWSAEATIRTNQPDGVILAYGGTRHGYSLFLQSGKAVFAVRIDGEIYTAADDNVTELINKNKNNRITIKGVITPDKKAELYVNGKKNATINLPDFILENPVETLQIGTDKGGKVNGANTPNFKGWIEQIEIKR